MASVQAALRVYDGLADIDPYNKNRHISAAPHGKNAAG